MPNPSLAIGPSAEAPVKLVNDLYVVPAESLQDESMCLTLSAILDFASGLERRSREKVRLFAPSSR
jgi:hypothetical protein